MPKLSIYLSQTFDPWFNLATEDYLFQQLPDDGVALFLWRNEKTVVIGRAQNPWLECNLDKMNQDAIKLARRQSGGGAVYHDLGNSNFTFLTDKRHYDKTANLKIVTSALKTLGIEAEASGRNDIHVQLQNGEVRKISGSAFRETAHKAFHHGTVLINVDMSQLAQYLQPRPKKLAAKGVTSVRSRVMNIADINPAINHEVLSQAIIEAFLRYYGGRCEITLLDHSQLTILPELQQRYLTLSGWDWRFGKTLPFTQQIEHQFSWGNVIVQLNADDGKINTIQIFSDSLHPEIFHAVEIALTGIAYDPTAVSSAMQTLNFSEHKQLLQEFSHWLTQAIA